uniref:RNA-directed DNA polymerase n=1 Tax=Strigamia maritima TaxID=126957 RepID=T1ITT7_STRMM
MDTGASSCFIGEQVLPRLHLNPSDVKPLKSHYNVAAAGIDHEPLGKVRLAVQWGECVTWFDFIVLKEGVPQVVVGHNFMRKTWLYLKPRQQICCCDDFPDLKLPYIPSSNVKPGIMQLQPRKAVKRTHDQQRGNALYKLLDEVQMSPGDVPTTSPIRTTRVEIIESLTWSEKLVKDSNCTAEQRQQLKDLLETFKNVFTDEPGCTKLVKHQIELTGTPRSSPALTEAMGKVPPKREKIISAQRADPRLFKIIQFIKHDKNNHEIKSESRGYIMDGELLVFFAPTQEDELDNAGNGFKAAIPRSLVRRVLFACHGHPMSAHEGILKTKHRVKQIYHWKRMSRDVRDYVRSCQDCQQYKPNQAKATAGEYTPHNISAPWETVCVDLMDPKPVGINQYKWLLITAPNILNYSH